MKNLYTLFTILLLAIYSLNTSAQTSFEKPIKINHLKTLEVPWIPNFSNGNEISGFSANTFTGIVNVSTKGEIIYKLKNKKESTELKEVFIGSNQIQTVAKEPSPTKLNYFIGENQSDWKTNIQTYKELNLNNAYHNIDIRLKAYSNNIEKVFFVKQGANPNDIKIKISGANKITVNSDGELQISMNNGDIEFTKPIAYQIINDLKVNIGVEYIVDGLSYSFKLGQYNKDYTLVIDPLIASTYIGGLGDESGESIVFSASGSVFIAGTTTSGNYPIVEPAYDNSFATFEDVFISRLSGDLKTLEASTYIGGVSSDFAHSIKIDNDGNLIVCGTTMSSDFPMAGTPVDNIFLISEAFVLKINPALDNLIASTFLGGNVADGATDIAIDAANNIFVTGSTNSPDFPMGGTYYDNTHGGAGFSDVFVSKLNPTLSTLLASTYVGGTNNDNANSIRINTNGDVFITGLTFSMNYPSTAGSSQFTKSGDESQSDAFVSKLNPALDNLLASTFLGGMDYDEGTAIGIDKSGAIFVAGNTNSFNFPTTTDAYNETINESDDVFVSKFTPDLTTLMASTFVGGTSAETCHDLIIDEHNDVYIVGETNSTDYPTASSYPSFDNSHNGLDDIFISKLNIDLSFLMASTFVGSSNSEMGKGITLDNFDNVIITGNNINGSYPVINTSYDDTHNGSTDVIVTKLDPN